MLVLLIAVIMTLTATASEQTAEAAAVTMVSYVQTWKDSLGTIALKNNSDSTVYNMVFALTYFNSDDKELETREFTRVVEIKPGATKKIDVKAYRRNSYDSYYLSAGADDDSSFKLKFRLKRYNFALTDSTALEDRYANDVIDNEHSTPMTGNKLMGLFVVIGAPLVLLILYILLLVVVGVMANHRHRDVVIWVCVSIFITPFVSIPLLLLKGNSRRR